MLVNYYYLKDGRKLFLMKVMKKSLLVNTIYNGLYNGLNIVFPLVTIPYLSRILGAGGLGMVNYSRNIVSWFLIFASLGIPRYGVREIAKTNAANNRLNRTFTELFSFNFISTTLCSFGYLILINSVHYFDGRRCLYLVTGLQLFLNVLNVDYVYQGIEEYGYITKRSFAVKLLSLIAMFLFVRTKSDYIKYALIQSLAVAGNYIFNFVHLHKYVAFEFRNIDILKHVSPILILLSTQLAVNLYSLLDTTMLGILCTDSVVGYYSNVHKIILTISTITASLGGVMLPRLSYLWNSGRVEEVKSLGIKAQELICSICLPVSIGVFVLAPQIVRILFGNDFLPCIKTLRIFAPFVLITTIGNLYGTQFLMAFGNEKALLVTVSVGSVINIVLNGIFIPSFQQDGAAAASVITELIVLGLQMKVVNKYISLKSELKFSRTILLISIAIYMYLIGIQSLQVNDIIVVLLSCLGAGIIFLSLGLLLNNTAIVFLVKTVENVIKKKLS